MTRNFPGLQMDVGSSRAAYSSVECKNGIEGTKMRTHPGVCFRTLGAALLSLCISITFLFAVLHWKDSIVLDKHPIICKELSVRKEWRSLSKEDQVDYLNAVLCLRTLDSKLGMEQSLYDDFPFIHSRIGNYSKFSKSLKLPASVTDGP